VAESANRSRPHFNFCASLFLYTTRTSARVHERQILKIEVESGISRA
jgi:hypothetical protein